jgi:putative oxidoreductase
MSDLALLVGRIALVAIFPVSAYYKIAGWPDIAGMLERAAVPYPVPLAAVGTAAEAILPFLVVLGIQTRLAAFGLIIYTIAATLIGHQVWAVPSDRFFGELMNVLKNAALIGGLLVLMAAGPGRYALSPGKQPQRAV